MFTTAGMARCAASAYDTIAASRKGSSRPIVAPDAPLKVYLTASEAARAARRAGEGTVGADRDAVAADLARQAQAQPA